MIHVSSSSAPQGAAGPPAAPQIDGLHALWHLQGPSRDPLGFLLRIRADHGDVVTARLGRQPFCFVFDADAVKRVLVDNQSAYSKQTRGYRALRVLLGNGLVTSEGAFWKRQRRIAQPAFHRRRLRNLVETMRDASADLADGWSSSADGATEVDVGAAMMRLTLRIAGETLFGVDLSDDSQTIGAAVTDLMRYFRVLFMSPLALVDWLPTPAHVRGRRAIATLDGVVHEIIEERRRSGDHGLDLLGMLMDARDETTGEGMSDAQLRDEVVTMLTAGHETTASALTWTFYLLSKHPEVARRVQGELDEVLPEGAPPTPDQVGRLAYTEQVLHEAMRLYPPVWAIARRADQDDVLAGRHVAAGSYVVMSPYAVHRHPRYWDNPEGFDPGRFSEARLRAAKERGRPREAYFPFASGPRKCIGDHFAKMEALVVLGTLLRRYRLDLVAHRPVHMDPTVTLRPRDGLWMTLTPR